MFDSYDQDIGMLTNKTSKKLIHYINNKLESFQLTTEQWVVLSNLSNQNKISQKALAQVSGKDQPTLTRIIDILERKKFVERHPSKDDRRSFSIHITEDGINICEKVGPFLEETFKELLNGISNEKLKIYNDVLLQIDKNLSSLK